MSSNLHRAAAIALIALGCASADSGPEPCAGDSGTETGECSGPIPRTVRSIEAGAHTPITGASARIARTPAEWAALWDEHTAASIPTPPLPEVDFETRMVVGVFLGQRPSAGYAVEVVDCEETPDALVLHVRETRPSPDRAQASVVTTPYQFVSVPHAPRIRVDDGTD